MPSYLRKSKLDQTGIDRKVIPHSEILLVKLKKRSAPTRQMTLASMNVVVSSAVHMLGRQRITKAQFENMVKENGGRVYTNLPGGKKGLSTNRYFVLCSAEAGNSCKLPASVKEAESRGFKLLVTSMCMPA